MSYNAPIFSRDDGLEQLMISSAYSTANKENTREVVDQLQKIGIDGRYMICEVKTGTKNEYVHFNDLAKSEIPGIDGFLGKMFMYYPTQNNTLN